MEGLWKSQRAAWYNSRQFSANEIIELLTNYKYVKIGLRYNKFYEAETDRPKFVFHFEPSNTKYGDIKKLPTAYEIDLSDLVDISNVIEKLKEIRQLAMWIQDGSGNLDENYYRTCAIENIADGLLKELDSEE